jgi:hypothetical protein
MNKKKLIGISIFFLIFIGGTLFFVSPKIKEANIKTAIKEANYCKINSDCVDAGGKCPFGCFVYVNKNEVNKISKLIKSYKSNCIYGCFSKSTVICENKKCKEIFNQ